MEKSFIEFQAKKEIGECDICLDDIGRDETVIITACCSHNFHKDCVKDLGKCPMCRGEHFMYVPKPKPKVVEKIVYRDRHSPTRRPRKSPSPPRRGSPRTYRGRTPPIPTRPVVVVERLEKSGPIPYDILMEGGANWAPIDWNDNTQF